MICECLYLVGCEPQDTRDPEGKETFFIFQLIKLIMGNVPYWYRTRDVHGTLVVSLIPNTRMYSSRMRTARCNGRLPCHARLPATHAYPPPYHAREALLAIIDKYGCKVIQ